MTDSLLAALHGMGDQGNAYEIPRITTLIIAMTITRLRGFSTMARNRH